MKNMASPSDPRSATVNHRPRAYGTSVVSWTCLRLACALALWLVRWLPRRLLRVLEKYFFFLT